MRVGVMEKVLRQPRASLFQAAKALGFDGVELEVREDLESVREARRESGLRLCSLICPGDGLGSAAVEERAAAREHVARVVEEARSLGAPGIMLPLFEPADLDDAARVERLVSDLRAVAAEAGRRNVALGWENGMSAADTREVLERVDSDFLRCYFDFANVRKRGADPAAEIRALGSLVYQVHAKNVERRPLDAPGVDLRACLRALKDQGYAGWIVLETAPGDDPLASAAHNLRVLRAAWDSA